ncbi:MAG TPA: calcium/sodium antiporter [Flavobacteriaceae bacterium]|nr:calcium/sodium antiporter [Flavobacteriaceae bacterium]
MFITILILLAGFVALIWGATKLVDAASSLAVKNGVPSIVIGLTIVAFGTSAPELAVNVFAATEGSSEIVLGNVIGSNIFNVLAVLGICSLIYPLTVNKTTTLLEIPLSLLAGICVLVMGADIFLDGSLRNTITRSDAIILLLFFSIFLVYNMVLANKNTKKEEIETKDYSTAKAILFIVLGLAGLVGGGQLIVNSAVELAQAFGLSERVIGLTVVSIGTSLPELATSVVAVRKKNVDIAIGNVVGSNIFNIFFILGISATVLPVRLADNSFFDIFVNIAASLLLVLFILTEKKGQLNRWGGIVFVCMYIAYLTYLLI